MIPFTIYTRREPVSVVSPFDDSVELSSCSEAERLDYYACRTLDLPALAVLISTPTRFRVRALSPLELRQLRPLLPLPHPSTRERLAAEAANPEVKLPHSPEETVVLEETLRLFARAGLEGIEDGAPTGWDPSKRIRIGGLRLWAEDVIGGLPDETVIWLGAAVSRLTHSTTPEQKKSSG
jgi:hypothetical protein